ncbi:hypothetical protein EV2_011011 [Malus domestica]
MIKLSPSSAPFPIQSIDYQRIQFQVYDSDACLPKRLLNFTIPIYSLFQPVRNFVFYNSCGFDLEYYPDLLNVTLLNCSTAQSFSTESSSVYFMPIKCLSVPGNHQVLATLQTTTVDNQPVSTCTLLRQLDLPIRNVDGSMHHCEPGKHLKNVLLRIKTAISVPTQIKCSVMRYIGSHPLLCKKSKGIEEKENEIEIERFLKEHKSHVPTRYTHGDIKRMTNGFKKKLGEGGFRSVYSGELPNGVPVAIKVLNDSKGNGEDFINELGTIGKIHHVNVVRLLGFSAGGGKRAVIYELMPNGSLEKFSRNFPVGHPF